MSTHRFILEPYKGSTLGILARTATTKAVIRRNKFNFLIM